jgi:hypothetical protein
VKLQFARRRCASSFATPKRRLIDEPHAVLTLGTRSKRDACADSRKRSRR